MKSLLKFLGLAAVIVFAGLWIMTVSKSCNKNKLDQVTTLEDELRNQVTEVTDDVDSLFEGETEEEGLFDEEGDEIASSTANLDEEADDEGDEETTTDLQKEIGEDTDSKTATPTTKTSSSDGMEYMVIGGAFLTEANAKAEVKKLQKKGYSEAEVVTFDFSKYYSVCVERTASLSAARATKAKLIKDGNKEAYVHKKRSYKNK